MPAYPPRFQEDPDAPHFRAYKYQNHLFRQEMTTSQPIRHHNMNNVQVKDGLHDIQRHSSP